jgi:hypothetical protein
MKQIVALLAAATVMLAAPAFALENVPPFQHATVEQSEQSLELALESASEGMQVSAALTVQELKAMFPEREFTTLIIPLMRIVKNEDADENTRVVAAIALHGLRSDRGDFAIARTAEFTDQPQLKRACQWLAYYRVMESRQKLSFLPPGDPDPIAEDASF